MKKTLLLFLFFLVISAFELMGQQVVSNNNLYVGYSNSDEFVLIQEGNGGDPSYQLTNGGTTINNVFVGYGSNSTNNTNYFSQTYAYIPGSWYVNYQGKGNVGVLSSSGFYVYGNSYLGYQPGSSNGSIQVVGSSYFSGNPSSGYDTNFIGYQGSGNTFLLNSSSNSFTYTIMGGTNTNDFSNLASNNTFIITNSAKSYDAGMIILSSGNNLTVTDSSTNNDTNNNGSSSNGGFYIYGYSNTVTISNGSVQNDEYMYIGASNTNNYCSNNTINIFNNSSWNNEGNSGTGRDLIASSGNKIIISNNSTFQSSDIFVLGYYGSSNSIILVSNSVFINTNDVDFGPSNGISTSNGITKSNSLYIYDGSHLDIPNGNLNIGTIQGSSGNIYISNNSSNRTALAIESNIYLYNGNLSLHGTNASIGGYNGSYMYIYLYNGILYFGENTNALSYANGVNSISLGNYLSTNTNTNASLYLSTNGTTSMYIYNLYFYNNVNIYNINPSASQQIINVTGTLYQNNTASNIGSISLISNVSLDNNIDPIINGYNSNNYNSNGSTYNFTLSNITGATLGSSSNPLTGTQYLYFWIPTNTNITVAQSINETNAFNVNSLTYTAGTFTVSSPGVTISNLSMLSNTSLILTNEALTIYNSLSFFMSTLNTNTNLLIGTGITLSTPNTFIGAVTDANCKLLNEGTWDNSSNFFLGYGSGGNTVLDLTNGGVLSNAGMTVIGSNGNNALNIVSNTTCYASNFIIESAYIGNSNIVNVNGGRLYVTNNSVTNTNSALNYSLIVGYVGSHDYLNISNGGYVTNSLGVIGYSTNSSNNYAYVTGTNSQWINTNGFYVGFRGDQNNLLISNGGSVYVKGFQSFVGLASSSNTVVITGTNSLFSNQGNIFIGYHGDYNSLFISNGGTLINNGVTNNSTFYIAAAILGAYSNNNSVTISSNATWSNYGNLYIGIFGSSNSVTNNGGTLYASAILIGCNTNTNYVTGSNNKLVINGGTNNVIDLNVGSAYPSSSSLIVSNNASLTISSNFYNYGYISNGGTITASYFYNYGTLVGNPVNTSVSYNSTSTLPSSGMMRRHHVVEMPPVTLLGQNDTVSINEENESFFIEEILQLASSLVYAQKSPPTRKAPHKKAKKLTPNREKVDS